MISIDSLEAAMQSTQSDRLLTEAKHFIPGGVNSPVRAFKAVDGNPPFIARAEGCWLWDEDGNRFLDLIGSWGPMIVGHGHPSVQEAILNAAGGAITYIDNKEISYNQKNFDQPGIIVASNNKQNHRKICSEISEIIRVNNLYPN